MSEIRNASLRAKRSNPENVRNGKIAGLLRFARNDAGSFFALYAFFAVKKICFTSSYLLVRQKCGREVGKSACAPFFSAFSA